MKKIFLIFLIFSIGIVSAQPNSLFVNIQTTDDSGNIETGTFDFLFNISTDISCSGDLYSNFTSLTTDSRGIISYELTNVNVEFNQTTYFCYTRNGIVKVNRTFSKVPNSYFADNVSWNGIINMPSGFADNIDNDTTYSHLSNFTDDLDYSNKNVNKSDYWNNFNIANSTQISNNNGVLNILESWLTSFTNTWFSGKTTNDLTEGSLNKYDNQSWNETHANNIYLSITDQRYNETDKINAVNTTANIEGLGFVQGPHTVDTNETTRFNALTGTDCPSGQLVIGVQNDGTVLCATDTTGSGSHDGLFINYTNVLTTGNITNGSLHGYPAGNSICNSEIPGSHMCSADEVLNTINNGLSNANFTATFRISEVAPGFLAQANDCEGWTSQDGSALGSIFVASQSHTNTYGSGSLVSCSASRAIGCCK